jgi:Flp pilus assembly pilin Flp
LAAQPVSKNTMTKNFLKNDNGQGLAEYALIFAFVALVAIVGLRLVGNNANNTFNNASSSISTSTNSGSNNSNNSSNAPGNNGDNNGQDCTNGHNPHCP